MPLVVSRGTVVGFCFLIRKPKLSVVAVLRAVKRAAMISNPLNTGRPANSERTLRLACKRLAVSRVSVGADLGTMLNPVISTVLNAANRAGPKVRITGYLRSILAFTSPSA